LASASGGPVRTLLTGLKNVPSGNMVLTKTLGRRCPYEAANEYHFYRYLQMETRCVAIVAQPFRNDGVIDGRDVSSIIDVGVIWDDGTREVCEVKSADREPSDDAYGRKVAAAFIAFNARGFKTRVITPADFANDVRDKNIDLMFPSRFVVITERHKSIAAAILRQGGGHTTARSLVEAFGGHPGNAKSVLFAMHARRLIEIDLLRPFGMRSHVKFVPRLPTVMPTFDL